MSENNDRAISPLGVILLFLLVIILPLAAGIYFAPRLVPEPRVGIIRLYYDINPETAAEFKAQLMTAREDPSIKALVVVVNSPGGTVSDSEELFLELLEMREEMPVVATADFLAASGGFYIPMAADEFYAKTGSLVGNVGVRSFLSLPPFLDPTTVTTGPYKDAGFTPDGNVRRVESLKFIFLEAVATGRGDRLVISPDVLSRGEVFGGLEAEQFGVVDGIASTDEAIDRAAELAGLRSYEAVELFAETFLDGENAASYLPPAVDLNRLWAVPTDLPPGIYYRYIPAAGQ